MGWLAGPLRRKGHRHAPLFSFRGARLPAEGISGRAKPSGDGRQEPSRPRFVAASFRGADTLLLARRRLAKRARRHGSIPSAGGRRFSFVMVRGQSAWLPAGLATARRAPAASREAPDALASGLYDSAPASHLASP